MKRIFLAVCGMICFLETAAQYVPNNSQAFQFMSLYNPGFTGVENFDDLKFSYRYQWAGFGEHAPRFVNLSFQKRIKQPLDLSYNALRMSDQSKTRPEQLPKSRRMIHGMGVNLFQSSVGILKSVGGSVSYAINYPLSEKSRLAFGASALIENRKLAVGAVEVRDPDPFYDHLLRSSTAQTDVNLRVGVLLYGEHFYLGVSYLPLLNVSLQASDLAMEEPFYRGAFQIGYGFPLNADVLLKPGVAGLLQMNNDLVVDYGVKAFVQDKVWLGLSYRSVESGIAMLGFNINSKFSVSYSFELSVGDFRRFDDGSHELVLAARLNNLKRFSQYIW